MTSVPDRLRLALRDARKARDQHRVLLFSTVLADVRNREIELGHTLSDVEAEEVLRGCVKRRREATEQYQAAGRVDLAARETAEGQWLDEFLPPALDVEAIRQVVQAAIADGATQLGPLMAKVMSQLKGRADGKMVNQIAREELAQAV